MNDYVSEFLIVKGNRAKLLEQLKFLKKNFPEEFYIDNTGFIWSDKPYKKFGITYGQADGVLLELVESDTPTLYRISSELKDIIDNKDKNLKVKDGRIFLAKNTLYIESPSLKNPISFGEVVDNSYYVDYMNKLKSISISYDNTIRISKEEVGNTVEIDDIRIVITNFLITGAVNTSKILIHKHRNDVIYQLTDTVPSDDIVAICFSHSRGNITIYSNYIILNV